MANAPDADDWSNEQLEDLFAPLTGVRKAALAVSGGPDSTALMYLFTLWRAAAIAPLPAIVFTVDHGLRPGSAAEAETVARLADRLGVPHTTLHWDGPKPSSDIQAAARTARYRLLEEAAVAAGADVLLTAHTLDDQAETLLLALKRGSGVYGLAGMPAERRLGDLRLIRPLIGQRKARLMATLAAAGIAFAEDPSNRNSRFTRAALRSALPELAHLGFDAETLAATATRLSRAAAALDHYADRLIADSVHLHPGGFLRLDPTRLLLEPDEVVLRTLARLLRDLMGHDYVPRFDRLLRLVAEISAAHEDNRPLKRTLADCVVRLNPCPAPILWLYPERGRSGFPELNLAPGETRVWHGRTRLALASTVNRSLTVRALGSDGRRLMGAAVPRGLPAAAVETVASAWHGDDLLAVPAFGYAASPIGRTDFVAEPLAATRLHLAVAPTAAFLPARAANTLMSEG